MEYHAGLGLSDHAISTCNLQISSKNQKKAEPRFQYHKGDYKKMNQNLLEIDWETDLNTEDAWTFFSSMLNDQIRKYIPTSALSKDKRRIICLTMEAIAKHKRKQQTSKRYRLTGDRFDYIRATTTEKK